MPTYRGSVEDWPPRLVNQSHNGLTVGSLGSDHVTLHFPEDVSTANIHIANLAGDGEPLQTVTVLLVPGSNTISVIRPHSGTPTSEFSFEVRTDTDEGDSLERPSR